LYFSRGTFASRLHVQFTSLGLNASSSLGLRNVTLETNGALGADAATLIKEFPGVLNALLQKSDWDEIRVDALLHEEAEEVAKIAAKQGMIHHTSSENSTYLVDLEKIRTSFGGNYLASRSSNTRAQLRKALRKAEQELGKVELRVAQSNIEAQDWLNELAGLHQTRWNTNGKRDGFAIPMFRDFQNGLVQRCFEAGTLQMLKLVAGEKPLAYLYNFVFKGQVLFYMSGVDYDGTEQYKPGMLAHWFAIEHNLVTGAKTYDFLAGTNRYKESLCTDRAVRVCIVLRRPTLLFRLENGLRQLKRAKHRITDKRREPAKLDPHQTAENQPAQH
jgi:CelD/BcsL family acetyltransferase involved in cellulose biosynthesis